MVEYSKIRCGWHLVKIFYCIMVLRAAHPAGQQIFIFKFNFLDANNNISHSMAAPASTILIVQFKESTNFKDAKICHIQCIC